MEKFLLFNKIMLLIGLNQLIKDIIKQFTVIKKMHDQINISHLILPSHILLTLFNIYNNDSASRYSIVDFLALPMTRARKVLTILEENGLIIRNIGRKGSTLTEKGFSLCESIFKHLKLVNPYVSVDLGTIVLGKFNSVTLISKKILTKEINAIEIRDTSLKCGALGASIFETFQGKKSQITIKFFNEKVIYNENKSPELDNLASLITNSLDTDDQLLIIASTSNKLPKYYFNPLFDSKKVDAFKVALVASVQSMWYVIESEFE